MFLAKYAFPRFILIASNKKLTPRRVSIRTACLEPFCDWQVAQSFTTTCLWEIVHVFGHLENQTFFFFFNGQKKNNHSLISWQKIQHRGYSQHCYYNLFSITFSCSYLFLEEYFHRWSLLWQFTLNILMSVTVLCIINWVGFPVGLILVNALIFLMLLESRRNTTVVWGFRNYLE